MTTRAELEAERDALEPHMQIDGGCRQQMFLGDCEDCERYWSLDDQIRDAALPTDRRPA